MALSLSDEDKIAFTELVSSRILTSCQPYAVTSGPAFTEMPVPSMDLTFLFEGLPQQKQNWRELHITREMENGITGKLVFKLST